MNDTTDTPTVSDPLPTPPNPTAEDQYSWTVAGRRVAWALSKAAVSFLASAKGATLLQKYGITVDPHTLQIALSGAIFACLVWTHDFLKHKYRWNWL